MALIKELGAVTTPSAHAFVIKRPAWFVRSIREVKHFEGTHMTQQEIGDAEEVWLWPSAPALAFATALEHDHVSGSTEPWIQYLVTALLISLQRTHMTVLECGGFVGKTSARLATTLQAMGGGTLIVAEWDPEAPERADLTQAALEAVPCPSVEWRVRREDALSVIASLPDESVDFAFLDDDHSHAHVDEELRLLIGKMKVGGIICGHDVFGSCDLQQEFARYGGYSLDLPRLGAAGGLGLIQCR